MASTPLPFSPPLPACKQVENPSRNLTSFLWSSSAQAHLEKLPETIGEHLVYGQCVRPAGFLPSLSLQSGLFPEMVSDDWQESEGEILSPHINFGEKRFPYS